MSQPARAFAPVETARASGGRSGPTAFITPLKTIRTTKTSTTA